MMDSTSIEEKKDMLSLKIVLVGCSTVGKSALINQYINNKFLETQILTIGCDKFSKVEKIKNLDIKINLWDTAGQERFRSLSPMFLKGSNIVILVYDITKQFSFDELQKYWINVVKQNTQDIILGIAANKSDLYEDEKVDEEKGRKFAQEHNGFFYSTSAKNYIVTQQLFINLAENYIEKFYKNEKNKFGLSYYKIKNNNNPTQKKKNCC